MSSTDSLEEIENSYKSALGEPVADEIIAECEFEKTSLYKSEYRQKVKTWDEAEKLVQEFIDGNDKLFIKR